MVDRLARAGELRVLVRVSFLLRALTLLVSLVGFVDRTLSPLSAAAIIFLALTSMAGIALDPVLDLLERHPILVLLDGAVMAGLLATLGTNNPLVLTTLSTCVVIGVLLATVPAVLATVVMVCGYLAAALRDLPADAQFISVAGFPVVYVSVVVLGQAFRRVADRKEESQRAFADLVSGAAASAERSRLARELHDSTAKTLQGLSLSARSMGHWVDRDPERAREEAVEIAESADGEVERLRQLLSTLRQDDLDQPFHESLAALARDRVDGMRLTLELDPVPLSAPGVRYELLAAAREALTNAAQHSGSRRVWVSLCLGGGQVRVEVRDAGRGFDTAALSERERDGHFGVRGFAERMELIGGCAEVDSVPGEGTTVRLVAPLMGLQEEGDRAG